MGSIPGRCSSRLDFMNRSSGGTCHGVPSHRTDRARSLAMGGCTTGGSKHKRSTSPNTHQAHSCINSLSEIKVSADALLQLARWCRQQHAASKSSVSGHEQGGSSCQPMSPPAPIRSSRGNECGCSPGPSLGSASTDHARVAAHATDASTKSTALSRGKGESR